MGYESADIDIALSDQTGLSFATAVNEYLSAMGKETRTVAQIMVCMCSCVCVCVCVCMCVYVCVCMCICVFVALLCNVLLVCQY
jgi:hypothetical protein